MSGDDFYLRFWGVRGTVASPGSGTVEFGGNTACVEVRCGDRLLIFDAGTGIRPLGEELVTGDIRQIDLFLTHCHYDHIEGLPFFAPMYKSDWEINIWTGHMAGRMTTEEVVSGYMSKPYFPIGLDYFAADTTYCDFRAGDTIDAGNAITLKTGPLNHPDGATGYRIEYDGRSICYITDTEHVPGKPDETVLGLIDKAGIVIYDSAFCDSDFEQFRGFGHSTWQEGIRLVNKAQAGTFAAFHHRPTHTDAALRAIQNDLNKTRPDSFLAREGMVLHPRS